MMRLLSIVVALCLSVPAHAQTKVSVAQPVLASVGMPLYFARDKGLFKKNGLEVDLPMFRGGPPANAALLSGSVEFNAADPYEYMKIADSGRLIRVATLVHSLTVDLIVAERYIREKGIDPAAPVRERLAKMKGMKFGSIVAGGTAEGFARLMLRHGGLDADKDIEKIVVGGAAQMLGAMQAGQIDGVILSPPLGFTAKRLGVGRILVAANEIPEFEGVLFTGIQARRDYVAANPGVTSGLVKALVEAQKAISADPVAAAQVMKAGGFADFDEGDLTETIRAMGQSFRPRTQTLVDWKRTQEFFRAAVVDPALASVEIKEGDFWTNRFVEDALK